MNSILLLSFVQCKHIWEILSSNDWDSLQDNGNNTQFHVNLKNDLVSKMFLLLNFIAYLIMLKPWKGGTTGKA
jgi:hypothetical protein